MSGSEWRDWFERNKYNLEKIRNSKSELFINTVTGTFFFKLSVLEKRLIWDLWNVHKWHSMQKWRRMAALCGIFQDFPIWDSFLVHDWYCKHSSAYLDRLLDCHKLTKRLSCIPYWAEVTPLFWFWSSLWPAGWRPSQKIQWLPVNH